MNLTKREILHHYKTLYKRLYHSPFDPLLYYNLLRLLRHGFKKTVTPGTEQYRIDLIKYYSAVADNGITNGTSKSLHLLFDLAYKSKYLTETGRFKMLYPDWYKRFKNSNEEYLNNWPIKKLYIGIVPGLERKYKKYSLNYIDEEFKSIYKLVENGRIKLKNSNSIKKHELFTKFKDESLITEDLTKVSNLYNFLENSQGRVHNKSLVPMKVLINLHRKGFEFVFERQKNMVTKKIQFIKAIFEEVKPFNRKYFKHIKKFVIDKESLNSERLIKFKNSLERQRYNENFKINPKFVNNKNHLRLEYLKYLSKQYCLDENDNPIYLTNLETIPKLPNDTILEI